MSAAMEIHDFIGELLVLALTLAACIAAVGVIIAIAWLYLQGLAWDRAVDVVGSQYLGADSHSWDWSKGDLPVTMSGAPRARINTPAYRNGGKEYHKRKGIIMPPEPEEVEVDADDTPVDEPTDAPTIEWDEPNYDELRAKMQQAKVLTPRK